MGNADKLIDIFSKCLGLEKHEIHDEINYDLTPQWDSKTHMDIISEIDEQFNLLLEADDIIELNSFAMAKEILKKYEVEV